MIGSLAPAQCPRRCDTAVVASPIQGFLACVCVQVVDRDLPLCCPDTRDQGELGPAFVPMLRLGLIQVHAARISIWFGLLARQG